MTDENDEFEDQPDEAAELLVRRALGAAAGPARMPADVRLRLDLVLADLVSERAREYAGAEAPPLPRRVEPVVPMARRWLTGLVAAAAVVVAAAGFGAVLRHGGLTSAPTASEARGPSTAQQATGGSQGTAGPPGVSNSTAKKGSATHTRYFAFDRSLAGARRVRSASIKADVTRIVNARVPQRVDGLKAVPHSLSAHLPARARCSAPRTHHGDQILAIRFDGARALLVVSAARHGTREAQIYSCGNTSTPVAHTRVATGGTPR